MAGPKSTGSNSLPFWITSPELLHLLQGDASTQNVDTGAFLTHGGFQYAPTPWDIVTYGTQGLPLPGLATKVKVSKKLKLDKKELAGKDGVSSTFQGVSPAKFEFDLLIWTPEQLNALYNQAMPVIFPGRGQPDYKLLSHGLLRFFR